MKDVDHDLPRLLSEASPIPLHQFQAQVQRLSYWAWPASAFGQLEQRVEILWIGGDGLPS